MASTFKRKAKPTAKSATGSANKEEDATATTSTTTTTLGLRGTKPWTGGTTLTSSGLRDLDGILGGGQPLGTCILIEEDRFTHATLSWALIKYWCAEVRQFIVLPS